jgi:hypothetical protein
VSKVYVGFCLLCGEDIISGTGYNYDDPLAFCDKSSIHNCVPGRILHDGGTAAYDAYIEQQKAAGVKYTSLDEIIAELATDSGDPEAE